MEPVTSTSVSPDGRRALLVALDAVESCTEPQSDFLVARGALQLLDLATGSVSFELELRSNRATYDELAPTRVSFAPSRRSSFARRYNQRHS